jgi:uncharacterized protein YcgL (UPF0745 family)
VCPLRPDSYTKNILLQKCVLMSLTSERRIHECSLNFQMEKLKRKNFFIQLPENEDKKNRIRQCKGKIGKKVRKRE